MPFEETEVTEAQLSQQQRSVNFGARTAEKVRAAAKCPFSLLPHEELSRLAAGWHEACAEGMLRGNYAPIDQWIRSQSQLASAEGFKPHDLLELMAICRKSAIEFEGWNEEPLSAIDEVIHDVFKATCAEIAWNVQEKNVPEKTFLPTSKANGPERAEREARERRSFDRNRLRVPIRVCGTGDHGETEEVSRTQSISRGGLYFVTREEYRAEQILKITYPYWPEFGGINKEYPARIVRRDRLKDGTWGVAVRFLQSLGSSSY